MNVWGLNLQYNPNNKEKNYKLKHFKSKCKICGGSLAFIGIVIKWISRRDLEFKQAVWINLLYWNGFTDWNEKN